jgi:hypothetical protein
MRNILEDINRTCPKAIIVCGGYSYVFLELPFELVLTFLQARCSCEPPSY